MSRGMKHHVWIALVCVLALSGCANPNAKKHFFEQGVWTADVMTADFHPWMSVYQGKLPTKEEMEKKSTFFSASEYRVILAQKLIGTNLTGTYSIERYVVPVEAWDAGYGDLIEVLDVDPQDQVWDPSSKKMPAVLKVLCKNLDLACKWKYRPSPFQQAFGQRSEDQRDHIDRGLTFKTAKEMGVPEQALLRGEAYVPKE